MIRDGSTQHYRILETDDSIKIEYKWFPFIDCKNRLAEYFLMFGENKSPANY